MVGHRTALKHCTPAILLAPSAASHAQILTSHPVHLCAFWAHHLRRVLLLCIPFLALVFIPMATAQQGTEPLAPQVPQTRWLGWDIPMQWVEDINENMTPDELLSTSHSNLAWQTLNQALNLGYQKNVVWLTFTVPTAATPGDPVWLLAKPAYLDSVTLYQRDADTGAWHTQLSGDHVPAHLKSGVRQHLFRLDTGKVALIRIETSSAMQFQGVILPSTEALGAELAASERAMGLYFGALAVLLLGIWAASVIFHAYNLYALVLGNHPPAKPGAFGM